MNYVLIQIVFKNSFEFYRKYEVFVFPSYYGF